MAAQSSINIHRDAAHREPVPGSEPENDRAEGWTAWIPSTSAWKSINSGPASQSRGPISPPPLRRSRSRTEKSSAASSRAPSTSKFDSGSRSMAGRSSIGLGSDPGAGMGTGVDVDANEGASTRDGSSRHATPASSSQRPTNHQSIKNANPKIQATSAPEWDVPTIVGKLKSYRQDIKTRHADLAAAIIESTETVERRVLSGRDLFANVKSPPVLEKMDKDVVMRCRFKQHIKNKKDQRDEHHQVISVKTNKDRVPPYRFHHVEIKKNVLTPNTMLTFVPHLRDLETSEEVKYNLWLKELEDIDLKSGFKPMNRDEKHLHTIQAERTAIVFSYLDSWLENLAIPGCSKSTLMRYMAAQEPESTVSPRQKTDAPNSHRDTNGIVPGMDKALEMFADAFRLVFKEGQPASKQIELRNLFLLHESMDNVMDSKAIVPGLQIDNGDEFSEVNLATYCILGCLICFSHSCDHGEYDNKNLKRTFSLSSCSHLGDILKRRRKHPPNSAEKIDAPCHRRCHRLGLSPELPRRTRPWGDEERAVLRSIVTTTDHSKVRRDPICLGANFLNRDCYDVHAEFQSLNVSLPPPERADPPRHRNLSWYDRRKKTLLGDWQDHTVSHEHQRRDVLEPCFHEGPCAPRVCTCVDAGVLCEKFCGCTVESCAHKFTGCACHSQGKTCQMKQKEKPCICVQLNRECDPQLCGTCGVLERADPVNADDDKLHLTGCQNCDLQRGASKCLLLGQSQLEGVGYGLFTAEDIAQDEFVVEYVGELITHDEGVRREARRGDVFDEDSNISYVFTLLENEGIWVDAAIYGNLSRYINHASESDKRGCNITPRILYVNGEFRIKFTAMRDVKAGEELFFNYGENFPNLTKKLLDHKAGEEPDSANGKVRRPRRAETGDRVARKAPKTDQKKPARSRAPRKVADAMEWQKALDTSETSIKSRKRKRQLEGESDGEEYQPTGTDGASHGVCSTDEREVHESGTTTRPRKRTNTQAKAKASGTPTKNRGKPKTRGKRGGARPGSGRPRKHPLPVPKPAPNSGAPSTQAAAPTSAPTATAIPAATTSAAATVATETNASTAAPAAAPATTPAAVPVRLPASSPARAPKLDRQGTPTSEPNTPQHRRNLRGSRAVEVVEIEDSEGNSQQEDDDGDEDVVIRKRRDRMSRNRRPPAKFRDDEVWG